MDLLGRGQRGLQHQRSRRKDRSRGLRLDVVQTVQGAVKLLVVILERLLNVGFVGGRREVPGARVKPDRVDQILWGLVGVGFSQVECVK